MDVPATLDVSATLDVCSSPGVPAPNVPLPVDLLTALDLSPALHVPAAFAPLCLGRAHRWLSPMVLAGPVLAGMPLRAPGASTMRARLSGQ